MKRSMVDCWRVDPARFRADELDPCEVEAFENTVRVRWPDGEELVFDRGELVEAIGFEPAGLRAVA